MPITYDTTTLQSAIVTAMHRAEQYTNPDNREESIQQLASDLTAAIDAYVQKVVDTARVAFAVNTVVGTCPPGGGPLSVGAATEGTIA